MIKISSLGFFVTMLVLHITLFLATTPIRALCSQNSHCFISQLHKKFEQDKPKMDCCERLIYAISLLKFWNFSDTDFLLFKSFLAAVIPSGAEYTKWQALLSAHENNKRYEFSVLWGNLEFLLREKKIYSFKEYYKEVECTSF